ncbi:MAG: PQQ-binding-like beta-propeller repeat protein [Deltaproteobacteria bacterium]|nr:PQQ-binding-like beta-propeller repeat protein [Deltaproteobacteria bacterium]
MATRHASTKGNAATLALGPAILALACSTATVRREVTPHRDCPAGVVQMRWHTSVNPHPQSESQPEECATGALVGRHLVLGSRGGEIVGVDVGTGALSWSTRIAGGVDGDARYDPQRGVVYLGSDDGYLYAVEPEQGRIRWSAKFKGPIEHAPDIGPDALYLATGAERVFAVDPADGKMRWQYERDKPEGFTIHGHASPRQHGELVYAGFSDGYLVALRARNGEIVWSRSLAAASEQFVDVDATPIIAGDRLFAASFSGGLYGLRLGDGEVLWHALVDGTSALALGAEHLYAVSSREGLSAVSPQGNILWRQGLSDAGDLTVPAEIGPYLVLSGSRQGLFLADRHTGKVLQVFDPARGMCAAPTVDREGGALYVLANSGTLYALDVRW